MNNCVIQRSLRKIGGAFKAPKKAPTGPLTLSRPRGLKDP